GRRLSVQDLLPSEALNLREWLSESVKISPEIAEILLNAQIKEPQRLRILTEDPKKFYDAICLKNELNFLVFFPNGTKIPELQSYLCDFLLDEEKKNRLITELKNWLGIMEAGSHYNKKRLQLEVDRLQKAVQALIKNQPSVQLPE